MLRTPTARIIIAIGPNSGTTPDGIIISKGKGIVTVACRSEPSTRLENSCICWGLPCIGITTYGFVDGLENIESGVHVAFVPVGDPSPTASPQVALEMTKATNPYVVIPMHGNPQQMQEFSNLVEGSDLQATVTIPLPLEIIIPSEVVPEFGPIAMMILAVGVVSIIAFTARSKIIPRL